MTITQHRSRRVALVLLFAALAACGDAPITGPSVIPPDRDPRIAAEQRASFSLQWNATARAFVAERRLTPPEASRVYALLSVAQHATLITAAGRETEASAPRPLSLGAALVTVSAEVLRGLIAGDLAPLGQLESLDLAAIERAGALAEDIAAGRALGRTIAERVLQHASSDGSDATWKGTVPESPGGWYSSDGPGVAPMLPEWRHVRTWLMGAPDEFRPPPPPLPGSPEFAAALAEVRHIADTRTSDQTWIAHYWSDAAGSHTPPGHWNRIGANLMADRQLSERRATRDLALLNMALMDAGIACWDAKYEYWLIRPWQADPGISVPIKRPNFPAYVSGHATFSGAASEVLASLFPDAAGTVRAMADEAAMSRLYGGIHYRFDNDEGLVLGRRIGRLALALAEQPDTSAPWDRYTRAN